MLIKSASFHVQRPSVPADTQIFEIVKRRQRRLFLMLMGLNADFMRFSVEAGDKCALECLNNTLLQFVGNNKAAVVLTVEFCRSF